MKNIKIGCLILLSVMVLSSFSACLNVSYSSFGESYESSANIFENRKEEFIKVVEMVNKKEPIDTVTIKGVNAISHKTIEDVHFIKFDIGSSGMLGGQYWTIYYVSDDKPIGELPEDLVEGPEKECYFQLEKDGNNFYATKRIEKNWFFSYIDYDGHQALA